MRLPGLLDLRRPHTRFLWALALLFTVLNAFKPLVIDDSAYYQYARHIRGDPLHPYSFTILWPVPHLQHRYQLPHPANEVLAPPVLLYWWAAGLALFGESAFFWKLWLLPFSLLFVAALDALLRRFARNIAAPVLWMTVFSPTFLPSLNLMLDIPALALGLAALVWFFRAYNCGSMTQAAGAGLLAGLAMETKYTAFLVPCVMLTYALLFWGRPLAVNFRRRVLVGFISILLAAVFFLSCEAAIAQACGESHFLCNLRDNDETLRDKLLLIVPMVHIVGCLAPPVALLSLVALGASRRVVIGAGIVFALGYALIAVASPTPAVRVAVEGQLSARMFGHIRVEQIIFAAFGLVILGTAAAVLARFFFDRTAINEEQSTVNLLEAAPKAGGQSYRPLAVAARVPTVAQVTDWFLLLWLAVEVCGSIALSPFPAARRVMGIVIVGTLLAARLASRTCQAAPRQWLLRGVAAASVALGLAFYGIDLDGAFAEKKAAERAASLTAGSNNTVWYVGHWGFQHYAEREGMKPVIPAQSYLRPGDWLVVPDGDVNRQEILVDSNCAERTDAFAVQDVLPLRTLPFYYGGHLPVMHGLGPHVTVRIYRVTRAFVPASDLSKMDNVPRP